MKSPRGRKLCIYKLYYKGKTDINHKIVLYFEMPILSYVIFIFHKKKELTSNENQNLTFASRVQIV